MTFRINQSKNDVIYWFAVEHRKHPNMVDAILEAAGYSEVAVVVNLKGVSYKVEFEDVDHDGVARYTISALEVRV